MNFRLNSSSMRALVAAGFFAFAGARAANTENYSAALMGDNETPPVASAATGNFQMQIDSSTATPTIHFTMTYTGMSGNPTQSHLHFGPSTSAGGVMIFLCGGGGQPACPAAVAETFSGTVTAANVIGPAAQGIAAGDLTNALEALRDGLAYANLHSAAFPAGELRGQVRRGGGHGREND